MIGTTYSTAHYEEFEKTGNQGIFEDVIDKMILEGVSGMNESFRNVISSLSKDKKRMTILGLLDKDLNLFKRIKALTDKNINKMDHTKDIILMLREYVKVGEVEKKKFGEVMTPLELVKEMLATLPEEVWSNPNLKWLDPANGTGPYPIMVIYKLMKGLESWEPDAEKRYKHIVENMIYVCELQPKNMFLYMCAVDPFDTYKLNIYTGSFLESGFDKHMKDVWGVDNFDVAVGNPPFNQMIDMLFVQKSYKISDKVLFVHPSTWLLDEKGKQKKFTETKKIISKDLQSVKFFNANKIFGIQLFVPCVITFIDKIKDRDYINCIDEINEKILLYDDIDKINKYSNLTEYPSIKNKLSKKIKLSLKEKINLGEEGKFYVNLSQIRGHVDLNSDKVMLKSDFYTLCTRDLKPSTSKRQQREKTQVAFDTEEQADNFLEYVKTNFVRFCLSINKINQNLYCGEMSNIPWLDFNQKWNDEDLYKLFDLDENEINFINSIIPKYY
jgi:hypothetical protein